MCRERENLRCRFICAAMSAMITLRRISLSLSVAAVWLIAADRLPAPVQELPDASPASSPSPKAAKPKKQSNEKRASSSNDIKSKVPGAPARSEPAPGDNRRLDSRFAGKWFGTIQTVPWGPWSVVLAVDPDETTLTQHINAEQPLTAPVHRSGEMLQARFPAGLTTITWSLMPQPDGTTARVRFQAFMNDFTATFRRSGSESAGPKK